LGGVQDNPSDFQPALRSRVTPGAGAGFLIGRAAGLEERLNARLLNDVPDCNQPASKFKDDLSVRMAIDRNLSRLLFSVEQWGSLTDQVCLLLKRLRAECCRTGRFHRPI
jgi:hypothetical protein